MMAYYMIDNELIEKICTKYIYSADSIKRLKLSNYCSLYGILGQKLKLLMLYFKIVLKLRHKITLKCGFLAKICSR